MELSSVCELSSALRGDDLEKSELVRKKITLELAIKQQEGRLSYEVDELLDLTNDTHRLNEKLGDVSTTYELSKLKLIKLQDEFRKNNIIELQTQVETFLNEQNNININEIILTRLEALITQAENKSKRALKQQKHTAQEHLDNVMKQLASENSEREDAVLEYKNCENKIGQLDERAADLSTHVDSIKKILDSLEVSNRNTEQTVEEAESRLHAMEDASHKEDFSHSAELGKRLKAIDEGRSKSTAEQQTIDSISHEANGVSITLASLSDALMDLQEKEAEQFSRAESAQREIQHIKQRISDLHSAISRIQSETAATTSLSTASKAHNFRDRAAGLEEDIVKVQAAVTETQAEIHLLQEQLDGSVSHPQLESLVQTIQEAEKAKSLAQTVLITLQQQVDEQKHIIERNSENLSTLHQDRVSLCISVDQQRSRLKELQGKETPLHAVSVMQLEEQQHAAIVQAAELHRQTEKLTKDQQSVVTKAEALRRELHILETQVAEKRTAASAKHIATQKQTRVSEARDAKLVQHRQEITRLNKMLLEEDKRFQHAHQEAAAAKIAKLGELERQLGQIQIATKERHIELSTLRTVLVTKPQQPNTITTPVPVESYIEENTTQAPAETTTASVASTDSGKDSKDKRGKKRKTMAQAKQGKRGKESHRNIHGSGHAKQRRQ